MRTWALDETLQGTESEVTASTEGTLFTSEVVRRSNRLTDASVTVVIPVWDEYVSVVHEAVASVLAQRTRDLQVLVIDNASTKSLPKFPTSVAVERLGTRRSVGAARNHGLALAGSRFILFLDADDLMTPGTLNLLLCRIDEQPEAAACCCLVTAWNSRTGRLLPLAFPSRMTRSLARWHDAFRLYALMTNRMPTTGCMLMRTEVARAAGGFVDANYAEDWGLNVGLTLRGGISFLPHVGRLLRVHATSLRSMSRDRTEVERAFHRIRERVRRDPATPSKLRLSLPLLSLYHRLQTLALTPRGKLTTGEALWLVGDSGPLGPHPDGPFLHISASGMEPLDP